MILRLSAQLAAKLKVAPSGVLALDSNPFADWSSHVFTAGRTQYVILMDTASLYYSTIFCGRGISTGGQFLERAWRSLREFMEADELSFIDQRYIAPARGAIEFSKPLNPSITASLNNLIAHAKSWLTPGECSSHETASKLNDLPCASFEYRNPREIFTGLANKQDF